MAKSKGKKALKRAFHDTQPQPNGTFATKRHYQPSPHNSTLPLQWLGSEDIIAVERLAFDPAAAPPLDYTRPQQHPAFSQLHAVVAPMYKLRGVACAAEVWSAAANNDVRCLLFIHAMFYKFRDVMTVLVSRQPSPTTQLMNIAAANGRLDLLRLIRQHHPAATPNSTGLDLAARRGKIDMVKHLHHTERLVGTTNAVDDAAANGFLPVVAFLQTKAYGCTVAAAKKAVTHGHTDIVAFLYAHWPDVVSSSKVNLVEIAAANGHALILQFLEANDMGGPSAAVASARSLAVANRHTLCVAWLEVVLHDDKGGGRKRCQRNNTGYNRATQPTDMLKERLKAFLACWRDNRKPFDNFLQPESDPFFCKVDSLVTCIYDTRGGEALLLPLATHDDLRPFFLAHAIVRGFSNVIEILLRQHKTDAKCLDLAAAYGRREMYDRIKRICPTMTPTNKAMDYAAANGHFNMVWYLHSTKRGCTKAAMDDAAANGHLRIVYFLHQLRYEGCTSRAMDRAAANGYVHVLTFLGQHRKEGATLDAIQEARTNGHKECVAWLDNYFGNGGLLKLSTKIKTKTSSGDTTPKSQFAQTLAHVTRMSPIVAVKEKESLVGQALEALRRIKFNVDVPIWSADPLAQMNAIKKMQMILGPIYTTFGATHVKAICDAIRDPQMRGFVLVHAMYFDYNDVVREVIQKCQNVQAKLSPIECAAAIGKPEMFALVVSLWNDGRNPTRNAMDYAAKIGRLELVQQLHKRGHRCTELAMDEAAERGHLAVVQYLHQHRTEGCTTRAMDTAAGQGHLEVVQFLHEHRREGCTTLAMDSAAQNGHLHVLRYLHAHRTEGTSSNVMQSVYTCKTVDVVKWLHEVRGESIPPRPWNVVFEEYYSQHEDCTCAKEVLNKAAANGEVNYVQVLLKRGHECSAPAMDSAATCGHLDIVKLLHKCGKKCTTAAMDGAIAHGHLNVVQFLFTERTEGFTKPALYEAIENGHTDVVRWVATHSKPSEIGSK
ncbi:Aste57867_16587 [Aphanomyces stellatus]|uniref:Aste57867_16587 protein n=1 Tax=Aphanomyces stellatus TaxID=120398 RepID=A0A485L5T0_9STRA|nr:hypothetical protein As57867_016530 [Aphanomyces stellatus]VFT93358.1 Aste57867_16587 [Aphanomyces stellatus]